MSVLDCIFRASDQSGPSDLTNPAMWLQEWAAGGRSSSGEYVSPQAALALAAYYAAIRGISEDIGKLPLITYRRLSPRGKERLPDHPLYSLLHDSPSPRHGAMTWREIMISRALSWGNGYALIVGSLREVRRLQLLHPALVKVKEDPDAEDGALYEVRTKTGEIQIYRPERIIHIRGPGEELQGWSIAALACETIGIGLAQQRFWGEFFAKSAVLSGVIQYPAGVVLGDAQKEAFERSLRERFQGRGNAWGTLLLQNGATWQRMGTTPKEALSDAEANRIVEEIARWFRMPPHKLQQLLRATYSNIEHQSIEYVVDTLTPWMVRFEQEVKRKLLWNEPDIFSEHLVEGLLRGDSTMRAKFYHDLFMVGAISQNDIRERENMNPVPGGDTYYIPLNMIRSEDAAAGMTAAAAKEPEEPPAEGLRQPPDPEPPEEDDEDEEDSASALMPVFLDAAERALRRQAKQVDDLRRRSNGNFPETLRAKLRGDAETWSGIFYPGFLSARRLFGLSAHAGGFLDAAVLDWIEDDLQLLAANESYDLKAYTPERASALAQKVMEAARHG